MKFKRIHFPGRTLFIDSVDERYRVFTAYFQEMWVQRFQSTPEMNLPERLLTGRFRFIRLVWYFLGHRYKTVVFLNPDHHADRAIKWAAYVTRVKDRVGFAPLKNFEPLNFSLPFNTENHHLVHQLKIFFEYLVGEKMATWKKPPAPRSIDTPGTLSPYGVVALDLDDPVLPHVQEQLLKFLNLMVRKIAVQLIVEARNKAHISDAIRQLTQLMTDRAIEKTTLVRNPAALQLAKIVGAADWVTGVSARALNAAALAEVRTVSIVGPLNERVWQPFSTRARVLAGEFDCRPCTKYPGSVVCTNAQPWACVSGIRAELLAATIAGMGRAQMASLPARHLGHPGPSAAAKMASVPARHSGRPGPSAAPK